MRCASTAFIALVILLRCHASQPSVFSSGAPRGRWIAPARRSSVHALRSTSAAGFDSHRGAEYAFGPGDPQGDSGLPRYDPVSSGTAVAQREEKDQSIEEILRQLESIQQGNPKKIVILGTRHCTFLHQQIVELLSYALVLSGNHVYTSGAIGTHTAVIRGALRAEDQSKLTVILPQTIDRQPQETRDLLTKVEQVVELGHNELPLSYASRLCNSELLTMAEQLIIFAFHDSHTLKEAVEEGKARGMLVTVLWLD